MDKCMNTETDKMIRNRQSLREGIDVSLLFWALIAALN